MKQTIISLRWRMILLVAVIPLLVLIPIFLVFGNRFTSAYREAYWKKADIIAKQVVYSLDELGFSSQSEDSNGINNALVNYLSASGLDGIQDFEFIALVDANGYIVGHSTPELAGTVDDRLTNLNQDTVYKRTGNSDPQDVMWVKRRQFLTEDYYLITHPLPLSDTGDTQLYIVISENVTLVNPPIMSLIITGGILVILVIIIMQIFLNNTILSPLHAIAEGATVIGAGDL